MSGTEEMVLDSGQAPPPGRQPRRRSRRAGPVAAVVLAALVVAGFVVNLPYYALAPDRARPVAPLISLPTGRSHPVKGEILLTDVLVSPVRLVDLVPDLVRAHTSLVSQQDVLGSTPPSQFSQVNQVLMDDSIQSARVAALRRLGYQVPERYGGAVVVEVEPRSAAAAAHLQVGEIIESVAGRPTPDPDALRQALSAFRPGSEVVLSVAPGPGQAPRALKVRLGSRAGRAFLGVASVPGVHFDLPFQIRVDSDGIGGPSAGLAFTLGIIDGLTSGDLTGGARVAATGTIDVNGSVGPIGGVAQKAVGAQEAGATVFLVPRANAAEARAAAPPGLKVVPVSNLDQALAYLGRMGGDLAGIPPPGGGH
jgi:PDZ domain-containing protein